MCGSHQAAETGGWGLKFLKKIETRQPVASMETSPSGCCLRNVGDCSTSMNILVPASFHSGPRNRNGDPSSLIRRWGSGGGCDCGGWDIGCPITVGINNFLPYSQELDTQKIMSPMSLAHHLVCSDFLKHDPCPPDVPHCQSQVYLATIFKLSRLLPRQSTRSPLDNITHQMVNASQAPDLKGIHREIHGIAEQIRIMNENMELNQAQLLVYYNATLAQFHIDHNIPDNVLIERPDPNEDANWEEREGKPHTDPDMVDLPGRTKIPAESSAEEGHGFCAASPSCKSQ
ncbi:hypothetical protein Acr_08g0013710 [Actinidia rufa]|uniref:Uncharacterized protein n=1 Tax=Actinidia rufa TaxID=165716 RepID=A0A7J0F2Q0_9ERIC|nr:hypothetical protein Acr_08g0013710 [Actinidia rufa]